MRQCVHQLLSTLGTPIQLHEETKTVVSSHQQEHSNTHKVNFS